MSWRENMLQDMAEAGAIGHPAVVVSGGGEPLWSPAARLSAQRPLASDEIGAAEELAVNLGIRRYLIDCDEREVSASRIDDFRALGMALYGPRWVLPMSKDLDTPLRTAQRWAEGKGKGPTADQLGRAARAALERGVARELAARIAVIWRLAAMRPAAPARSRRTKRTAAD